MVGEGNRQDGQDSLSTKYAGAWTCVFTSTEMRNKKRVEFFFFFSAVDMYINPSIRRRLSCGFNYCPGDDYGGSGYATWGEVLLWTVIVD